MLGSAMIRVLSERTGWQVYGTIRSESARRLFRPDIARQLLPGVDAEQHDSLVQAFIRSRPEAVVNCVGLVKQLADAEDPLVALPVNSLLPHRLARLCEFAGARLVHVSTDCVFSGRKGGYRESDPPDAEDVYGRSKLLGEVACPHAITLRTSIIGHELRSAHGLIGWFLSQENQCKGYRRAIFSGLPTVVLAQIVRDLVLPRSDLSGVYHVASQPISKYDLLRTVAEVYGKPIEIVPDDAPAIDRSLNAERFNRTTGYVPPSWPELVRTMHAYQ